MHRLSLTVVDVVREAKRMGTVGGKEEGDTGGEDGDVSLVGLLEWFKNSEHGLNTRESEKQKKNKSQ